MNLAPPNTTILCGSLYLEIANDTNTGSNPLTNLSVSNVVLNFSG